MANAKQTTMTMLLATTATLLGAVACGGTQDGGPGPDPIYGECTAHEPAGSPTDGSVLFRFTTHGSKAPLIAMSGTYCSPFSVSGHQLVPPYAPQCEGAPPESPHVGPTIPADGSTLEWDGNVYQSYQGCADCSNYDRGVVPMTMWTRIHLAPGRYTATFAVYDAPPRQGGGSYDWGNYDPNATAKRCDSTRTVSVTFNLPATGQALVNVDVPAAPELTAAAAPRDLSSRAQQMGSLGARSTH